MQLPNVPDEHFDAAMQQVSFLSAKSGDVLLRSGFNERRSLTVQSGSIVIRGVDGVEVAEATVGAVAGIGQIAWETERMAHTVLMRDAGDVMVLSRDTLAALFAQENQYAHAWECHALDQASRYHQTVVLALGRLATAKDTPQQAPTRGSMMDGLVQHTGLGRLFERSVKVGNALALSRLFAGAAAPEIEALEASFQLCCFEADAPGEPETVFDHAGRDQVVGLSGVLGSSRLATLVATSHTVALAITAERARELAFRYDPVGNAFRVALLRATSDASKRVERQVRCRMLARDGARRSEAATLLGSVRPEDDIAPSRYTSSAR